MKQKRAFTIILSAIILLSAAGCSSKEENSKETSQSVSLSEESKEETEETSESEPADNQLTNELSNSLISDDEIKSDLSVDDIDVLIDTIDADTETTIDELTA